MCRGESSSAPSATTKEEPRVWDAAPLIWFHLHLPCIGQMCSLRTQEMCCVSARQIDNFLLRSPLEHDLSPLAHVQRRAAPAFVVPDVYSSFEVGLFARLVARALYPAVRWDIVFEFCVHGPFSGCQVACRVELASFVDENHPNSKDLVTTFLKLFILGIGWAIRSANCCT